MDFFYGSRRLRLLHQREAKRLWRLRQRESIMKQLGTTKRPHTKCLCEVQKKPRLRIRPEKIPSNPRELLVLPSLTVDGKMLVACSKIRQMAFDEGSINRLTLAGRVEHFRSFYQSKLTQFW